MDSVEAGEEKQPEEEKLEAGEIAVEVESAPSPAPVSSDSGVNVEDRVNAKLEALAPTPPAAVKEVNVSAGAPTTSEVSPETPSGRSEVSAAAIARMMGLATVNEFSLLEGKLDLLSSRVNNMTVKLERMQSAISRLPTSSDVDRVDINIGALRTLIKESLDKLTTAAEKELAVDDEGTLKKATIMTSESE